MSVAGKRILIRVDGSHAIGMGHVYRMKALAEGLAERGAQPRFLTLLDASSNKVLAASGLPVMSFRANDFPAALARAVGEVAPDWILQDVLATGEEDLAFLKSAGGARLVHFDDTGAGLRMADLVINAFVFHWGEYSGHGPETRLFEGAGFMILQKEIEAYRDRPNPIAARANRITMSFGGTDTHGVTSAMLHVLNGIRERRMSITVILGPGTIGTASLSAETSGTAHDIKVKSNVPDLFAEFHASDLVLCGGGISLYELATLGIPSLAVACEPHETKNIRYWESAGTTMAVGFRKELDPGLPDILTGIEDDWERRKAMSAAGRSIMEGSGLRKVLEILETQLP